MKIQARKFHREVCLDSGIEFGRPVWIDIETAIRQLALEDGIDRFIDKRSRGRLPHAILRRMQPELKQDVIGFESSIRCQFGPPVSFMVLQAPKKLTCALSGLRCRCDKRSCGLESWHHTRATGANRSA